MSEQEKKRQRIDDLLHAEIKCLCLLYTKERNFLRKKKFFLRKRMGGGLNKEEEKAVYCFHNSD